MTISIFGHDLGRAEVPEGPKHPSCLVEWLPPVSKTSSIDLLLRALVNVENIKKENKKKRKRKEKEKSFVIYLM